MGIFDEQFSPQEQAIIAEGQATEAPEPGRQPLPDTATVELPQDEDKNYVPLRTLTDERMRRQEVERENAAWREQHARLDERLRMAQEMDEARMRAAYQPPPDPNEDFPGYLAYRERQIS